MTDPSAYKDIPGWFSENEARRLYKLVTKVPGDILEAGTYCGRSTSCVCEAIRGRGRKFISYDWAASNAEEFHKLAVSIGSSDMYVPPELQELWTRGTNSYEEAQHYLQQAGLLSYVTLVKGDFRTDSCFYDVLFLDVVHSPEEIHSNLPAAIRQSKPGAWLALHDMRPDLLRLIDQDYGAQVRFQTITDTLALFIRI